MYFEILSSRPLKHMNKWELYNQSQQSPFLVGIYVCGHWSLPHVSLQGLGRNLCLRPLEFAPRFSTRLHTYFIINKTNFFCHFSPRLGKPYCLLLCLQTTSSRNWKWQLTIENKRLLPVLSIFRYQKLKANERNYSYELCNLWKATVLFIYFYLFIYFAKKGLQILLNNW